MKLHEAVLATYAIIGQEITDLAATAIVQDLQGYPSAAVGEALQRCRKELRRISLADILDRIPGQLPGPEEAWAICAPLLNDERATAVWTQEIAEAFGVALGLRDDPVAARMSFKETYGRLKAEAQGKAPRWFPTLGQDPSAREGALLQAVEKGRLTAQAAQALLPNLEIPTNLQAILTKTATHMLEVQ